MYGEEANPFSETYVHSRIFPDKRIGFLSDFAWFSALSPPPPSLLWLCN